MMIKLSFRNISKDKKKSYCSEKEKMNFYFCFLFNVLIFFSILIFVLSLSEHFNILENQRRNKI